MKLLFVVVDSEDRCFLAVTRCLIGTERRVDRRAARPVFSHQSLSHYRHTTLSGHQISSQHLITSYYLVLEREEKTGERLCDSVDVSFFFLKTRRYFFKAQVQLHSIRFCWVITIISHKHLRGREAWHKHEENH